MHLPSVAPSEPDSLALALSEVGACVLEGVPGPPASTTLREELWQLFLHGALKPAEVGRGRFLRLRPEVRGDFTHWLSAESGAAATAYLATLDALRGELNRRLFLGLSEVEAHFASYPVGTFYQRHRDRFQDSDARVVSLVTYLNPDWLPEHGGALRLYLEGGPVDVWPKDGVTVCFLSELDHEVLPATRQRLSIAAWMRQRPR